MEEVKLLVVVRCVLYVAAAAEAAAEQTIRS